MDDVKRYGMSGFGGGMIEMDDGRFVESDDFDAQRLRADTAEAERDKYRKVNDSLMARNLELQAAEQRNAELTALLREGIDAVERLSTTPKEYNQEQWVDLHAWTSNADAALNPKPEAGSQSDYLESCKAAERALSLENQRILPARFKCLACGEYHEGSGNLPCPKTIPYAGI